MLELRPTCEHCNKALPPESGEAMICSFECTFCKTCVDELLNNVCPNCGGGFTLRPVRPTTNYRNNNCLTHYPASAKTVYKPLNPTEHEEFSQNIKHIPANKR